MPVCPDHYSPAFAAAIDQLTALFQAPNFLLTKSEAEQHETDVRWEVWLALLRAHHERFPGERRPLILT